VVARIIHVAVAVIVNEKQQVLISKRPDHVHQGGLWEFPGGKVEAEESVLQALSREIKEELNLEITNPVQLIQIKHQYANKLVFLDVWLIREYSGIPEGMEGQPVCWKKISDLDPAKFPEANMPIINAIQLPDLYMITGKFNSQQDFKEKLQTALQKSQRVVQLRCKNMHDMSEYLEYAQLARTICNQYDSVLLLNTSVDVFKRSEANGLHLNSQALFEYNERPVDKGKLLSVSCHSESEMKQAEKLGADILLLSPVKETSSHPGVPGIGWEKFTSLAQQVSCSVYALGGMSEDDLIDAKQSTAQGIAAISSLWVNKDNEK
jgi:8-oxo-dGTP diphosphatase